MEDRPVNRIARLYRRVKRKLRSVHGEVTACLDDFPPAMMNQHESHRNTRPRPGRRIFLRVESLCHHRHAGDSPALRRAPSAAAALLAYAAAGGAAPEWRWGAALLAGGVALASHGTKASARAAVNASPEPLSNWALSFGEDVLAVWLTWMATAHPLATTIIVSVLVALSAFLLYHLFRFARRALQRLVAP